MTLSDYLKAEMISPSRFAGELGIPASTVLRVLKGEREPGLDLMRKISAATKGCVNPNDFFVRIPRPATDGAAA